jgi:hypothetical protein
LGWKAYELNCKVFPPKVTLPDTPNVEALNNYYLLNREREAELLIA